MKRLLRFVTKKRILLAISCVISFLIFAVLSGVNGHLAKAQESQMIAERWSQAGDAAQVSCFFSQNANVDENTIMGFEYGLKNALIEASIVSQSANENARLWASSYSATGSITLTSDQANVSTNAVGIGGDFFLFHPVKLKSGSYFSGNDVNKDYCLLDETLAWQLFGSNDIAGQIITINDIPHIITGVYEREEGRLAEAAGLDASLVYVSYETLTKYGSANKIGCYEIVMPNPVENYAYNYVKEHINVMEREVEIVENSSRYSLLSLAESLTEFGTRSMNGKAIIYPFWENIARGYEDIMILLLIFCFMFLMYPVVMIVIAILIAWRHKTWTAKSVYANVKDKLERLAEKQRAKRGRKKHEKKI